jgi:hypothetical protein
MDLRDMAFTVKRLIGIPILVVDLSGIITPQEIQEAFTENSHLIRDVENRVWCVMDFSKTELPRTFTDTLKIARLCGQGKPGSPTDPRIVPSFVVNNYSGLVVKEFLTRKHFGGVDIPVYFNLEIALQSARKQIHIHHRKARYA